MAMTEGFHPFEVTPVHLVYVGLGLFICIFSYLSLFIKERLYLGEAPIAAAFGIIVGPVAIGLFNPASWGNEDGISPGGVTTDEITLEIMRVTIALSVFAIGVELPKKYLLRHWQSIAMLLGPVMAWGWLISACFIYALIPGLDFLNSLVVAACVSPTDPILAQAVVGGPWAEKHVPAHVRHMLMCESGCNDGAAFPFLYLALYLTQSRDNPGKAIGKWFYETWAYEIILGTIIGALIGYAARKFMRFSERHKLIDRESFVAQYISLAIASMGVNVLLGSDDLLAAFACGTAFAWDGWFTKQTEDSNFSNIVDLLFNIATFIYIGALIPWHDFADATIGLSVWRLILLSICVLLTKRLPIILALWKFIPDIKTFREAVFSGHFGPMGVGAIFIATLGRTLMPHDVPEPPETSNDVLALTIQPIVYFFVLCSIVVHGFTIPFFAFGKNARKRAHTLTRTWSRNPSMRDDEPSWMNRVRRVKTGDEIIINHDDISADKMSAQQLAMIGRGAIGGYREDELRRESSNDEGSGTAGGSSDSPDRTSSFVGLLNRKTERDLEKALGSSDDLNEKLPEGGDDDDSSMARKRQCQDVDGIEDWEGGDEDSNPAADYLGDNCIEMRRYMEKLRAKKEAKLAAMSAEKEGEEAKRRHSLEAEEQDIGEAPMDRDIIFGRVNQDEEDEECRGDREGQAHLYASGGGRPRAETSESYKKQAATHSGEGRSGQTDDEESKWPKIRDWVEGHNLVLEYQKSYSDDPEVQVIPLTSEERDALEESETPAHDWVQQNRDELKCFLGDDEHSSWSPTEVVHRLMEKRVPHWWPKKNKKHYVKAEAPKEETQEDRDARVNLMYGAMSWAQNRREPEEDVPLRSRRKVEVSESEDSASPSRRDSMEAAPAVVRTMHEGKRGGPPIGPQDSSVPAGSTSAQDTKRSPRSTPSRRSSSSSSRGSASLPAQPKIPAAGRGGVGSLGPKRGNLRKKVLCGQIGLSGRRKAPQPEDDTYTEDLTEEGADEPSISSAALDDSSSAAGSTKTVSSAPAQSATPRVLISEPPSPSHSRSGKFALRLSPASSFGGLSSPDGGHGKGKGKQKDKFFPRSSSAGAGLAPAYRTSPATSPISSPILRGSTPGSRLGSALAHGDGDVDSARSQSRNASIHWLDIADGSNGHREGHGNGRSMEHGSPVMSRRKRTHSSNVGTSGSVGFSKELRREDSVRDPDEEDAEDEEEDEDRHGGLGIRDGMSRIGAFFSNFTAPKGEGMGNPGPTSHPHLFPDHHSQKAEEGDSKRHSGRPTTSPESSRRGLPRLDTDELDSLRLPPSATSAPAFGHGHGHGLDHRSGSGSGSLRSPSIRSGSRSAGAQEGGNAGGQDRPSLPRVLLNLPDDDGPPVSPGQK